MKRCTLVFPRQYELVWLSLKKLKVGAGLWNGWGGKEEDGDKTMKDTAIREFFDETGGAVIRKSEIKLVTIIDFHMAGKHIFRCYVYLWCPKARMNGQLKETPEMGPGVFFPRNELPLDEMMPADREWLPRILSGERLRGRVYYNADNSALERESEYEVVPANKPLE